MLRGPTEGRMSSIELRLASGDDSLSVRRFGVEERLSEPFGVSVWARSPNEDIDLESVVGRDASFSIQSGLARGLGGRRRFTGICAAMDLLVAEPTGLSTYFLRIVPRLWLLGQRRGHRLFQHQSIPDIAKRLCDEWKVEHRFRLSGDHPKLELRVQYGETDYAFLARLLEEAGISYCCEDDDDKGSTVVFDDAPHARDPRAEPLPFVDEPNESAEREFVTQVRLGQKVQPGRFTLRDHDFRRSPRYQLFGATPRAGALEEELEHYDYAPGSFVVEVGGGAPGGLVGDDRGVARHEDKAGAERAKRRLEASRARRRLVAFRTNALDLAPGREIGRAHV